MGRFDKENFEILAKYYENLKIIEKYIHIFKENSIKKNKNKNYIYFFFIKLLNFIKIGENGWTCQYYFFIRP